MRKYIYAATLISVGLIGNAYAQPSTNGPSGSGPEGSAAGAPVTGSGMNPAGSDTSTRMGPGTAPSPAAQSMQKGASPASPNASVKQEK
jgi:hypothetical protein